MAGNRMRALFEEAERREPERLENSLRSRQDAAMTTVSTFDDANLPNDDRLRSKLLSVAYRMLGSVADAEDVVQDAFLRLHEADGVEHAEAWLVKVTTHLCLDRLRQLKRRAEYHGPWLPEPVSEQWPGAAADQVEMAESLSTAFLVLLETLSPTERAAYLLREIFHYEFAEIAPLINQSPVNVRQLTSRAKKRIASGERRFRTSRAQAETLSLRFFEACRGGNLATIESMLSEEAVFYSDGGGKIHAAPHPFTGTHRIAKLLSTVFRRLQEAGEVRVTRVNGEPGVVLIADGRVRTVYTILTDGERIAELYAVLNPDKLRHWQEWLDRHPTAS